MIGFSLICKANHCYSFSSSKFPFHFDWPILLVWDHVMNLWLICYILSSMDWWMCCSWYTIYDKRRTREYRLVLCLTKQIELKLGPKWPISINCRNIWPKNTVCEIISHLPLFGVLELGELEYPLFFVHHGTWRWHLKFLKTNWYPSSWSSSTALVPTAL